MLKPKGLIESTIEMRGQDKKNQPVIVSACLVGLRCRYDGRLLDREIVERVLGFLRGRHFVVVCPEQLGGLPTPRLPMEVEGGDGEQVLDGNASVKDSDGADRTQNLILGATETYKVAELVGAGIALLKDGSPSCGSHLIRRKGKGVKGLGVTAALFRRSGIVVASEDDLRNLTEEHL